MDKPLLSLINDNFFIHKDTKIILDCQAGVDINSALRDAYDISIKLGLPVTFIHNTRYITVKKEEQSS